MIDRRELRIGNYIWDGENEVRQVIELSRALIRTSCDLILLTSEVKPIPLTEGTLLRCGFKNEIDDIDGKMYNIYFVTNTNYLIEYFHSDKKYVFTDDIGLKVDINSLHQLQNLFYCLCGFELEVNWKES